MYPENRLLTAKEVLELYFVENRARVLEIASFLDRIDRAPNPEEAKADFRYRAFLETLRTVLSLEKHRTADVQRSLSDPTREPVEQAGAPAVGAWDHSAARHA